MPQVVTDEAGIASPSHPFHLMADEWQGKLSFALGKVLGLAHPHTSKQDQPYCVAQMTCRTHSSAAGEGQDQLTCSHDPKVMIT